jgi:hypothetical protein
MPVSMAPQMLAKVLDIPENELMTEAGQERVCDRAGAVDAGLAVCCSGYQGPDCPPPHPPAAQCWTRLRTRPRGWGWMGSSDARPAHTDEVLSAAAQTASMPCTSTTCCLMSCVHVSPVVYCGGLGLWGEAGRFSDTQLPESLCGGFGIQGEGERGGRGRERGGDGGGSKILSSTLSARVSPQSGMSGKGGGGGGAGGVANKLKGRFPNMPMVYSSDPSLGAPYFMTGRYYLRDELYAGVPSAKEPTGQLNCCLFHNHKRSAFGSLSSMCWTETNAQSRACRLPPAGEVIEGDMYAVIPFDDYYCAVTGLPGDVLAHFKSFMWAHPYGTNGACGTPGHWPSAC